MGDNETREQLENMDFETYRKTLAKKTELRKFAEKNFWQEIGKDKARLAEVVADAFQPLNEQGTEREM